MKGRALLRVLVTFATLLVAWLVTSSAGAAEKAPVCDPRGAIAFAPPPQIQDLEQSIDIVTNDDDCTADPLSVRNVAPDRAPVIDGFVGQESALPSTLLVLPPAPTERLAPALEGVGGGRPGFASSLERPPRA